MRRVMSIGTGLAKGRLVISERALSYILASVVGLTVAFYCIPMRTMIGRLPVGSVLPYTAPRSHEVPGTLTKRMDALQHLTGQLYWLQEPWHWPLFTASKIDGGVSIALTDSIPWVVFLQKLAHALVPWMQQSLGPYLTASMILQPLMAVFALRAAGCASPAGALAVAVLAGTLPAMLWEPCEEALSGHWVVLLAIALYFRIVKRAGLAQRASFRRGLLALGALSVVALGIHPYIDLMVLAFAAAVPVTLAARASYRNAGEALLVLLGSLVLIRGEMVLLGLGGAVIPKDDQYFPLFYQAVIFPVLRHFPEAIAKEGGFFVNVGTMYAGAGLIVLVATTATAVAFRQRGRLALSLLRAHAGLAVSVIGLFIVGLHGHEIGKALHGGMLSPIGDAVAQFRAGGRMIYPVSYLAMIAAVRFVPGKRTWAAPAVLALCCTLQLCDVAKTVQEARWEQAWNLVPMTDRERALLDLLKGAKTLVLRPTLACEPDWQFAYPVDVYLAALNNVASDQVVLARSIGDAHCGPEDKGPPADVPVPLPSRQGDVVTVIRGRF